MSLRDDGHARHSRRAHVRCMSWRMPFVEELHMCICLAESMISCEEGSEIPIHAWRVQSSMFVLKHARCMKRVL